MRGIKYVSFCESSGYGEAARRYLLGLVESGVPLTWCPMVHGRGWDMWYEPFTGKSIGDPTLDPFCNKEIQYDTVIIHTVPEYFPRWRIEEKDKTLLGYTTWETDCLPNHWPAILNTMDGILVPCNWNREVFLKSGVTVPVSVVPHIIPPLTSPSQDSIRAIAESDYVFYTINTWSARKNLHQAVHAYLDTFSSDDDVVFVVLTSKDNLIRSAKKGVRFVQEYFPSSTTRSLQRIVGKYRKPAKILLLTGDLSSAEIAGLHSRGDCYVSLTRGEGWGMGAFDSGTFGKPVIMTGFGGQLDYLSQQRAYLVDYELVGVIDPAGEPSYTRNQHWAEPDVKHASKFMREVYENRGEAARKGSALKHHLLEHFNTARVTEVLLCGINE